jgi:hypothetical protein
MGRRKQTTSATSIKQAVFGSPLLIALMAASLVVFVVCFVGYARRGGFWTPSVDARVFNEGRGRGLGNSDGSNVRVFPFQGEVYSDAERVREGSALALAGILCAAQRNLDQRPVGSVDELLIAVRDNGALPPGMSIDVSAKKVTSEYGDYFVRYRVSPLGIEVVSVGKGALAGAPFLVRLPDDRLNENTLSYYVALKHDGVTAPVAFAPGAAIIQAGWMPVRYRANGVSAEDVAKGKQWLSELKGNGEGR